MNRVILSPEYFPNPTIGRPISGAQIFVGEIDTDPAVAINQKQVSVQQEDGTIIPVSQPVLTGAGGVPLHNGSPVTILVVGDYALKVLDSAGSQLYYVPKLEGFPTGQSIDDMLALINITGQADGDVANMTGFFVTSPQSEFSGGGTFVWQNGLNKNLANGGTIVDPDNIGGFDGTVSTRDAFLVAQGGGVGSGCWVSLNESITAPQFGLVFDGATDDTAALQAALDAGPLGLLPEGDIFIDSSTINMGSNNLIGLGTEATRLVFNDMTGVDGISIVPTTTNDDHSIQISDLSIIAKGANGRYGIVTERNSDNYFKRRARYRFKNIVFKGFTDPDGVAAGWPTDFSWSWCIKIGDSFQSVTQDIQAFGDYDITADPTGQFDSGFIQTGADGGQLTTYINRCACTSMKFGIELGDRTFFQISHCDIARSLDGIVSDWVTGFSEGYITNTLVNSQRTCIELDNIAWTHLINIKVARHKDGFDGAWAWVGVRLDTVSKSYLSNIRAQIDNSVSDFPNALSKRGYDFETCGNLTANGLILGFSLEDGIYLNNVSGSVFSNIVAATTEATINFVNFNNNTRDVEVTGVVAPGTALGTRFVYDGTVNKATLKVLEENLDLRSAQPFIDMEETDGAVDEKVWRWVLDGGSLNLQVVDDVGSGTNVMLATRTADVSDQIEWRTTNFFVNNGSLAIKDGIAAPGATIGQAKLYVDVADGDLKIVFGDGTVKTIVTDT